ncbi:glycerol-3-phosphate acyltransferase [Bacillus sp. FJAT-45350]|uniref:glycerol-3-phosphate acyltransferase n=1 Tax=Bacillus sp. FJAT-45350 TaxID=2011014 RepID=UPI000BB95FC0|nr:glycerol-3-phosphate acyltransferase [Bacillus sp. FJAT-45350]
MLLFLSFCILAYIVGSIPTGKIIAKMKGVDIQAVGTKNIGASNMYLSVGKKLGFVVLLGDLGKAFFTLYVALELLSYNQTMVVALCLLIGNVKSIFLNFTGGKGIATSLGIFMATQPWALLILAILWFIGLFFKKSVLLTTISAMILIPYQFSTHGEVAMVASFLIILLLLVRHRENIASATVDQLIEEKSKTT